MARAMRSPGSALKPFIYAMAFDRLIIHPETVLDDRPRHFGDYAPSDFDGRFQGEVTAREALQYSLNVPAVAVLDRLGARPLHRRRSTPPACALRLPAGAAEPGLAIALGGAGITLGDLVTALCRAGAMAAPWHRCATASTTRSRAKTAIFGPARRLVRHRHPERSAAAARGAAGRGAARPPPRLQDRHLLRLSRRLGGRL